MNKRLIKLIENQPIRGGQFLDCYNQAVSDMAGTIRTTIDHSNMFFYTEEMKSTHNTQEPKCEIVGKLNGGKWDKSLDIMKRVYGENGLAPTQHTVGGENMETKIAEPFVVARPHGYNAGGVYADVSPCCKSSAMADNNFVKESFRIRKLTERECFRLMDVSDSDIDKTQAAGISRSQQYKLAGNSIVVACLENIFNKLLVDTTITELTLF